MKIKDEHPRNSSGISLGIVIPVYQTRAVILEELLRRIRCACRNYQYHIVITDDGSVPAVRLSQETESSVTTHRHRKNLGKGAALQSGIRKLSQIFSSDVIITIDADLQHPPEYIPDFIEVYQSEKAAVITGYRERDPRIMPFSRILSNTLTSLIISMLTGQLIRDSQCGFRLIDSKILSVIRFQEQRFHMESELLIKAGRHGYKIASVKIPTIYGDEKSSINYVGDTLNFVRLIARLILKRSRF